MPLNIKRSKGIEYLYFQAGIESIYLGPKNNPTKAKSDNVIRSLDYCWDRVGLYMDSLDELLSLLSPAMREKYASKYATKLQSRLKRHLPKD